MPNVRSAEAQERRALKRAERGRQNACSLREGLRHVRRREKKAALLMRDARFKEKAVPAVNGKLLDIAQEAAANSQVAARLAAAQLPRIDDCIGEALAAANQGARPQSAPPPLPRPSVLRLAVSSS